MDEKAIRHSPEDHQPSGSALRQAQRDGVVPRSAVLSLMVFFLSFAVLFAGPALAMKLIASPLAGVWSDEQLPPGPDVRASAVVTAVTFQSGKYPETSYNSVADTYTSSAYAARLRPHPHRPTPIPHRPRHQPRPRTGRP